MVATMRPDWQSFAKPPRAETRIWQAISDSLAGMSLAASFARLSYHVGENLQLANRVAGVLIPRLWPRLRTRRLLVLIGPPFPAVRPHSTVTMAGDVSAGRRRLSWLTPAETFIRGKTVFAT